MIGEDAILYYAQHPVEWVEDIIRAKPDPKQRDILRSVNENPRTTVRSGHGIGKSAVEAWVALWFLSTRPFPKVPCTAPTQHQLHDILWAEMSKWIRQSGVLQKELTWTKERVYMNGHAEEWFAVARTASTPDALQGFHAENVLYIIDEASGVSDSTFEPILGALSTEGARLLMCGNPTQLSGFFYESHTKNRNSYSAIHIDARESSRVTEEFVQTIANMYGEDSDVFRVRVKGDFPTQADDIFIPLPLIEASIMTEPPKREHPHTVHIGCDVARFGDDRTVIGYKVDEVVKFYAKRQGQDTMKTADDIVQLGEELVHKYKLKDPIPVKIDDGGVGGGVVDRLRQMKRLNPEKLWWLEVYPVKFGQRISHKYYDDSSSYMMSVVKRLLQPFDEDGKPKPVELILPDDNDLVAQLSTRKYDLTDRSKIRIESKKAVKKRGLPSPDEADCVMLLCLPLKPARAKGGTIRKNGGDNSER